MLVIEAKCPPRLQGNPWDGREYTPGALRAKVIGGRCWVLGG